MRSSRWIALGAAALLVILLLILAGQPIATDDLWFHLKMGQVYLSQGLWPAQDPMLHTASGPPVQHEWLFGVLVYGLHRLGGFQLLRIVHVLWVGAIVWLCHSMARRRGDAVTALAIVCVFVVLATFRLMQLRPDLVTITATLVVYRLLLEPEGPPSWGRVAAAAGVFLLWVNFHSLFAVGLALLAAGTLGTFVVERMQSGGGKARRLAIAFVICLGATFVNPRGVHQHLTFVLSSQKSAIWRVADEWTPFFPFHPSFPHNTISLHFLPWLVTDLLLLATLVAAIAGYRRYRRDGSIGELDPPMFLLAGASIGAMFISVRFLWLGIFPLLYVAPRVRPRFHFALALATVALLALYPKYGSWNRLTSSMSVRAYLTTPYNKVRFYDAGMRFLRDTGVEGNLYNPYGIGGYLGYWLAPRLRTFIDGRTEHYSAEVLDEATRIAFFAPMPDGETPLHVLDRRRVDFFFALGGPGAQPGNKLTIGYLYRRPGWLMVFQSADHAIYLRMADRNRDNLARIAAYYAKLGIPFDATNGFDPRVAIRVRPDWARENRLIY
jgi:hypothetical protein